MKLTITDHRNDRREFVVDKPSVTLGRGEANDIVLRESAVSRLHARLDFHDSAASIVDLGSKNGTWVDGARVERAEVTAKSSVVIGGSTVEIDSRPESADMDTLVMPRHSSRDLAMTETIASAINNTAGPRVAVHALGETREVAIDQDHLTFGRDPANDIVIDSGAVSRMHAEIRRRGHEFVLVDLDSRNGTKLRGRLVEGEQRLEDGDSIELGPAKVVFKSGFSTEELDSQTVLTRGGSRLPTVFIVPGIMGSELWHGGERIWPNVKVLLSRGETMSLPPRLELEARALLDEIVVVPGLFKIDIYRRLGDFLVDGLAYERGRNLFEFPYDWRQDNRESARKLAAEIERRDIRGPIVIIAHSMGCLISRYYIERLGGKRRIARLIQLGAPQKGSPRSLDILMTGKGVIPIAAAAAPLRATVATFPSMYQLLPSFDCVFDEGDSRVDVLADDSWVLEQHRPLLRAAREFNRELPPISSVSTICIFGYGLKTPSRVRLQKTAAGEWRRLEVARESSGDTVVPESSAVLEGAEIHPVRQPHGSLHVDNDVKMRLKVELTRPYG